MRIKTKFKQTEIGTIPEDWEVKSINEVAEVIGGGTPSTKNPEYWDGDIAWITPRDLSNFKFRYIDRGERNITKKGLENSSAKLVPVNTVLLTTRAPVGYVAIAKNEVSTNQGFRSLISKNDTKHEFLFYLLKRNVEILKSNSSGTTFGELSGSRLKALQFAFPDIPEQSAITKILSDLDSKIELNQQMNKTLEAIGQAIFKHWFIDFEFPNEKGKPYKSSGGNMVYNEELGKEIPKGWTIIPLDQAAEFTRGFSYKGSEKSKTDGEYVFVTLNSVKEFGGFKREFSYITSDRIKEKHFVHRGDIVVANTEQTKTGTLLGYPALVEFPFQYEKDKGIFSHHITKVTSKLKNLKHYLYYYLFINQQNAVKYNTGSVIWSLDVNNWSKHEKIILPNQEVLIAFESLMENIFLKSIENNLQIETLSRIRDSLLPKLMSGKIRVPVEAR